MNQSADSLWSPQTVIALCVLVIVAGTVIGVFLKADLPTVNTIAGLVVGSGLGGVVGFYFGSSRGSQAKDERAAAATTTTGGIP